MEELDFNEKMQHIRYGILFETFGVSCIKNKNVLELAPYNGWFSVKLKELVARLDLIELHQPAVDVLLKRFKQDIFEKKINVYAEDIHLKLHQLAPVYDVILCCGFLYHTPHPFWILEGLAKLKPEFILIDTYCVGNNIQLKDAGRINDLGMRQSSNRSVTFNLNISQDILIKSMRDLGYELFQPIAVKTTEIGFDLPAPYFDLFSFWKNNTFAAWFRVIK